jgi:uncharacterized protein (DUF697 family)
VSRTAELGWRSILRVTRELRGGALDRRPLVVDGARGLVPLLARELRAGGDASAVREGGGHAGAAALLWIGPPDHEALRAAARASVPVVAVTDVEHIPYVLDTALVDLPAGAGFPVDEITRVLARRLGASGVALASRLPVLRPAVVDELIAAASRQNGLIGAATFIPGLDMPALTLNQLRLVLRIALAHGHQVDRERFPELLGVVGVGFTLRAIARQALDIVPVAGWAIKGGVAYTGTRAVGEAARLHFETRSAP